MHSVEQEAVWRTFEDAFGTPEGRFRYRISLPYQQRLFFTPNASENASRTVGGRFWYRISLPYRKSLFFTPNASEDASRTRGGCFAHRMSTPYRRRAFPVPSPQRQAAAAAELRTYKERGRPLVDLVQYSANSYLLSWNLVHPSLKKATICLAAASPALMLASAV